MDETPIKSGALEQSPPLRLSRDERLNTLLSNVVTEVTAYSDNLIALIRRLSDIGRALSGIRDLGTLLEMIVDEARNFTNADAGTLYILENNTLRFKIVQNDSLAIRLGGKTGGNITFPPVELKESNVSAFVAINGIPVNIPDVYDTTIFDFTGPKKFDESTGYRSKSMLVVPMRNHEDDVIGVLQLLNAKNPKTGDVISFAPDFENLTESLASQAAVAITNVRLIDDMEKLFEAFVQVMATAIDEKSPVTGGHIRRVANLTMVMAETVNSLRDADWKYKNQSFTPEQMNELRIAAWMHDLGKVTTPVEVIEKGKKLQTIFNRIHFIDERFQNIIQLNRAEGLQRKVAVLSNGATNRAEEIAKIEMETLEKESELQAIRAFVRQCNEPGEFLEDGKIAHLKAIAQRTYTDIDGAVKPFLTEDELENLCIRKGSITDKERKVIQNHAIVTLRMLQKIPFTKKLKNIPTFAAAHHEYINGKGYPLGLKGDEIPFEGKMLAVADIAEALTAADRPYKKAMPLEVAYKILRSMAEHDELDRDLVEMFISQNIHKRYMEIYEPPKASGDGAPPPASPQTAAATAAPAPQPANIPQPAVAAQH